MGQTVFLTNATGYVGGVIAEQLLAQGNDIGEIGRPFRMLYDAALARSAVCRSLSVVPADTDVACRYAPLQARACSSMDQKHLKFHDVFCVLAVALVRTQERAEGLRAKGIEPVLGDLSDVDILRRQSSQGAHYCTLYRI